MLNNNHRCTYYYYSTLLFFFCIAFASPVVSQPPNIKFKHISNEHGLSNSTIECIFQDSRGFIWFGTRDGLNSFDGYQITVYKSSSDTNSISDNYIKTVYEDHDKQLWIGTINGLNKFNPATNKFTRYKTSRGLNNNLITSLYDDRNGTLWIATYGGGINLLNKKTGGFNYLKQQLKNDLSVNSDYINFLFEDKKGRLWIATNKGLSLYLQNSKTFRSVKGISAIIRTMAEATDGSLWLGTEEQGLIHYHVQNNTFKQYKHQEKLNSSIGSNLVRAITFDDKGNLWVGGINGGLNLYNKKSDSFYHYQDEPGNFYSLSQRTVSALFGDIQGNLWIGTHRGGVNFYSPRSDKFKLRQKEQSENSLSYNDVKAFCEISDGNLLIGTDGGGLNLLNQKTGNFTHYKNDPFNPKTIGSDAVLHITQDRQGKIWVGTWGGGLNLFNPKTGLFTQFLNTPGDRTSISSNYVQKTFEDSNGIFWVGTYYGGLNTFDRTTQKFKRVTYGADQKSRINGSNVISINQDLDDNLWIGTDDGGLNRYDYTTGHISHYFANEEKKPDLRVIFVDSKGRVWVGQAGLYLFDRKKNTFSLYTKKAGLASEFIKGMTEDDDGNFWISTSNGLTKFNPKTFAFKKYNTADGLQGLEFEANAYLKTSSGEMFFGGVNGFNSFFPKDIKINPFIPPLYLTSFQIFNKNILPGAENSPLSKDISLTDHLNLTYKQSTFSFHFAALNYIASENNRYSYILEGFDKDWINAGNNRTASYTNINPGKYTFKVRASNNDGIWNNEGVAVTINISPPFWATWWFRTLIIGLVCVIGYTVLQFKRKLELKALEERKREEIHQTQLLFFTNISHDFRTPLSLILGPLEKLLKEDKNPAFNHFYSMMYRNATRLMGLINELMDFRKVEAGVLKLKVISGNLNLFLDEIGDEFKDQAEEKNLKLTVLNKSTFSNVWFDRHILEKIVLNLIHNSIKYTPGDGEIVVELLSSFENYKPAFANHLVIKNPYQAQKYAYIRVADNGIGISKESISHLFERYYRITDSHLGSGVGLAFVKSLTMLHKGNIYVSSERQKGTEIIIALPCSREDYTQEENWIQSNTEGGIRLDSITNKLDFYPVTHANEHPKVPLSNTKHILIVDDNDELREFLRNSFIPEYQVTEAVDGNSGLEIAKEVFPDLIISDVMMPGLNGIQLCKLIKDDVETSHIPFLMLTAKDSLEAKLEGVESGADFYFPKPISINLLLITIKNLFAQRQTLKDHYSKNHVAEIRELLHSSKDKEFIDKLLGIIEKHLKNPDLDIEFLCLEIGMSRTKLYQKIKSITGQSIGEFIRTIRLRRAIEIMTSKDIMLTEVMYQVGIQTQSYFTKAFKKEFGKTPSQFLNEIKR